MDTLSGFRLAWDSAEHHSEGLLRLDYHLFPIFDMTYGIAASGRRRAGGVARATQLGRASRMLIRQTEESRDGRHAEYPNADVVQLAGFDQ